MDANKRPVVLGMIYLEDRVALSHSRKKYEDGDNEEFHIIDMGCDEEVFDKILEHVYVLDNDGKGSSYTLIDIKNQGGNVFITNDSLSSEMVERIAQKQLRLPEVLPSLVVLTNNKGTAEESHTLVYSDENGILQQFNPETEERYVTLFLHILHLDGSKLVINDGEDAMVLRHLHNFGLEQRVINMLKEVMIDGYELTIVKDGLLESLAYRDSEYTWLYTKYTSKVGYELLKSQFSMQDGALIATPKPKYAVAVSNLEVSLQENLYFYMRPDAPGNLKLLFVDEHKLPIVGFINEDGDGCLFDQTTPDEYVRMLLPFIRIGSEKRTVRGATVDGVITYKDVEADILEYNSGPIRRLVTYVENLPCRLIEMKRKEDEVFRPI